VPHLVIVGRSPMACTLADLGRALGGAPSCSNGPDFSAPTRTSARWSWWPPGPRRRGSSRAGVSRPAYLAWSDRRAAGRRCSANLADRGVRGTSSDRWYGSRPAWTLAGHRHQEIAVAILAELVQLRASGHCRPGHCRPGSRLARPGSRPTRPGSRPTRRPARQRRRGTAEAVEAVDPGLRNDRGGGPRQPPAGARWRHLLLLPGRLPPGVRAGSRCLPEEETRCWIKNEFEVAEPVEKVWRFFDNIPQWRPACPDRADRRTSAATSTRAG